MAAAASSADLASAAASATSTTEISLTTSTAPPSSSSTLSAGVSRAPVFANANSRSVSMASVSSDGSAGSQQQHRKEQQQLLQQQQQHVSGSSEGGGGGGSLTVDVKAFKEALSGLRRTLMEAEGYREAKVSSQEWLSEVLRILRGLFDRYPFLQCPELVHLPRVLIQHINSLNDCESFEEVDRQEIVQALDNLAMAFSGRVSEYLAGDLAATSANLNADNSAASSASSSKDRESFALGLELDVAAAGAGQQHHHPHLQSLSKRRSGGDGGGASPRSPLLPPVGLAGHSLTAEEVDDILMRHPKGVDKALNYAKIWDKYAKYVMDYVEKRASLEHEWAKGLSRVAVQTRPMLQAESHLPYQSLYCTALDQDQEMCTKTLATCSVLQGSKFMEPLYAKLTEHQKTRKSLKDRWTAELKQVHKSVAYLKKTKGQYHESSKDYERNRHSVRIAQQGAEIGATGENKVDKRKRLEEESRLKLHDHEEVYKRCVRDANERTSQLLEVKADVLRQVRELIRECDQTIKTVTVAYFQLQHDLTLPVPVQFQTLCERSRLYESGSSYTDFVRTLAQEAPPAESISAEPFVFELYAASAAEGGGRGGGEDSSSAAVHSSSSSSSNNPRRSSVSQDAASGDDFSGGSYRTRPERTFGSQGSEGGAGGGPILAWSPAVGTIEPSDTESGDSSQGKSRDTSPSASPMINSRQMPFMSAGSGGSMSFPEEGESVWDGTNASAAAANAAAAATSSSTAAAAAASSSSTTAAPPSSSQGSESAKSSAAEKSEAARTHHFRKLRTPRSCRECDSIIMYFQGLECQECGLCAHKKCLCDVSLQCGFKRLGRKVATFKVDLGQHLLEAGAQVPPLVCKCVHEIDKRGIQVRGIYRMSGVKHKVEKLCQDFEKGPELVVLSHIHPNVITNVLKLYLRQLPEPLISFDLYHSFIKVARDRPMAAAAAAAAAAAGGGGGGGGGDSDAVDGSAPAQESADEVAVQELSSLCRRLPKHHLRTLGFLFHHLHRVSKEHEVNNMPAFNLAIVFGPTLMRQRGEDSASLSSIVDNDHQTRAVQLLIEHAAAVFGPPESVVPSDYDKYTNPILPPPPGSKYGKSKGGGKKNGATAERSASVAVPMSSSGDVGGGVGPTSSSAGAASSSSHHHHHHGERRSFDAGQDDFHGILGGVLPGHERERESNEDYGASDEDDPDADAEAIPSCWIQPGPDEGPGGSGGGLGGGGGHGGKTKKSPLLAQPKIIKVTLGKFTGVEGVTPERLSTQDSLESGQRLAKQPSADVYQSNAASASSSNAPPAVSSRKSVPQEGGGGIPHLHRQHHSTVGGSGGGRGGGADSLFAKMGKAGKKHSLDEDYLSPPPSASPATAPIHPPLSERLSGEPPSSSSEAAAAASSSLPSDAKVFSPPPPHNQSGGGGGRDEGGGGGGGGGGGDVLRSSTSPGSGRSSLVIGIGSQLQQQQQQSANRSGSLSEDASGPQQQQQQLLPTSTAAATAEQRRLFLSSSTSTSTTSSSASGAGVTTQQPEHRVRIQVQQQQQQQGSSSSSSSAASRSHHHGPVTKQTSIDKEDA